MHSRAAKCSGRFTARKTAPGARFGVHRRPHEFSACFVAAALVSLLLAAPVVLSQTAPADNNEGIAGVVGDWHGDSICQVKQSACRDEESLYHFSACPGKPGKLMLQADKIVDGKPVTMGGPDCICDLRDHSIQCRIPAGTLQLDVSSDLMLGNLKLQDGTLWRKLTLRRVKQSERSAH